MLYCALEPGVTMAQFCERQLHQWNIDIFSFITFGVVNNIITRVHKYPLALAPAVTGNSAEHGHLEPLPGIQQYEINSLTLFFVSLNDRMIDGKHTFDELSTESGMSHHELNRFFSLSIYK